MGLMSVHFLNSGCLFDISDGTLIFVTFDSVDEYLLVALVRGRQLIVELSGSVGTQSAVIGSEGKMRLDGAEWLQVDVEFGARNVSVALRHEACADDCSLVLPFGGEALLTHFGRAPKNASSYEGFVGCMRDVRVNSDWLTPSWLAANQNVSDGVSGGCGWRSNCEPDPCNGRGICSDLWTRFSCDCASPFWGLTCSRGILYSVGLNCTIFCVCYIMCY